MKKLVKRFKRYINETYSNKLWALALITLGVCIAGISGDSTCLIFMLVIGVPLFLSKKNWITD